MSKKDSLMAALGHLFDENHRVAISSQTVSAVILFQLYIQLTWSLLNKVGTVT